jgi:hypothetical protein
MTEISSLHVARNTGERLARASKTVRLDDVRQWMPAPAMSQ